MEFKPSFRTMKTEPFPFLSIRTMDTSPLVLIKDNGVAMYANKPNEKDELIKSFDEKVDLLLWVWTGKFKSDVFKLDQKALNTHYAQKAKQY